MSDLLPLEGEDRAAFARGVALFNERLFFESHDVLEEVWRGLRGPARSFVQGLIQVAVAFHHLGHGNVAGASSVLQRAIARLEPYAPAAFGFDVAEHLAELRGVQQRMAAGAAVDLPRWRFRVALSSGS